MRPAEHLSSRFALGASTDCLPGRLKPDVLRPGIAGMRGYMVNTATTMPDNEDTPPFSQRPYIRTEAHNRI